MREADIVLNAHAGSTLKVKQLITMQLGAMNAGHLRVTERCHAAVSASAQVRTQLFRACGIKLVVDGAPWLPIYAS